MELPITNQKGIYAIFEGVIKKSKWNSFFVFEEFENSELQLMPFWQSVLDGVDEIDDGEEIKRITRKLLMNKVTKYSN